MAQPFNFTFGQDFFNAYQQSQRQKEEERQFNLKFAEEQRQRSLLDAFKQRAEQRSIELQNASLANSQADNARANLNQAVDIQDKYILQDKTKFFPYQSGTQALPNESLDVSSNPYLTGKVGIPKTENQLMTENQRITKALEKRRLDIAEREIALKEKGGGQSEASIYRALNREDKLAREEEDKQNKIADLDEETGNMLAVLQSGGDGDTVEFKGNSFSRDVLNKVYANKVSTLISKAGIKPTVNTLKLKAIKDYPDFNKKPKAEQRNILKKYIDDAQGLSEDIKPLLYKYAETYR